MNLGTPCDELTFKLQIFRLAAEAPIWRFGLLSFKDSKEGADEGALAARLDLPDLPESNVD